MNLPIYTTISIASLIFNFLLLVLLIFVFLKLESMTGRDDSKDTDSRRLRKSLGKKVSSKLGSEVDALVSSALESFNGQIKAEIEKISAESVSKMRGLSDFTQEQEKTIGRETQFLVANNFAKVEKELEEYKKTQLSKIDRDISEIVAAAAREVLGRAISAAEHEDLVNKALERAKHEKFFS